MREDRVLDGPASGEKVSKGGPYKYHNPMAFTRCLGEMLDPGTLPSGRDFAEARFSGTRLMCCFIH